MHYSGFAVQADGELLFDRKILKEYSPLDFEVMQLTGLHDKNNKDIWEGDIIEFPYYRKKTRLPIRWGTDGWWAMDLGWYKTLTDVHSRCEVIGNIYENPELLKEGRE